MKILALLPDAARHVLERSLTGAQRMTKAGGADSVGSSLREGRCDPLVFDPDLLDSADFETVQTVDGAARELVLRGADDVPEVLQRLLAALVAPSAPAILLSRVASHFRPF